MFGRTFGSSTLWSNFLYSKKEHLISENVLSVSKIYFNIPLYYNVFMVNTPYSQ